MMDFLLLGPWATGDKWIAAIEAEDEGWRCRWDEAGEAVCNVLILQWSRENRRLADRLLREPPASPPWVICAGWAHPLADAGFTLPEVPALAEHIRLWETEGRLPLGALAALPGLTCRARDMLRALGVPTHLRANLFLPDMLALCAAHPSLLADVSGRIYPLIARRHGMNPAQVERSLRLAVESTWDHAPLSGLNRFFGSSVDPEKGKPTNKEFLIRMSRVL